MGAAYNIPLNLELRGTLNVSALERTLQEIVQRHESLRTTFGERNGEAHQVIQRDVVVRWPGTGRRTRDYDSRSGAIGATCDARLWRP